MSNYTKGQKLLILLIFSTTLPFILLLKNVDWQLYSSNSQIFWVQLSSTLGSIIGFIGMSLLLWSIALGVKPLVRFFSPDLVWSIKIHTFIGKYGFLLILLHPFLEMYSYLEDILWVITPDLSSNLSRHIALGRVAFILLLVIWISSALLRSKLKYRPWLYIHYLTYPIIIFVFIHALDIGTYLNSTPTLEALWYTLLVGFVLTLLYRLYVYSGIGKVKYVVSDLKKHSNEILVIKVKPKNEPMKIKIGQFVYLQIDYLRESHPFTVMSFDEVSGEITFGVLRIGPFTKKLSKLKKEDEVFIDGPYGVFTKEAQNKHPKVILAGGIGVVPFVDLIDKYSNESTYLFYSVRKNRDLLADDLFKRKLGKRYEIYLSSEKSDKKNVHNVRLDANEINKKLKTMNKDNVNFFICGSKRYIKGMLGYLKELEIEDDRIFYEEFEL